MAEEEVLAVEGMTCGGCEHAVCASLQRLDGVIRSEADHRADRVVVRFDPEKVSEDEIKDRIRAAGYDVA